jgi:PAS domain S-box-containing protein
MSAGFWRALGFDPTEREHLAAEWQNLIFPEDGETALQNFKQHCADPSFPYDQLVRYKTSDGGTVTVRCRGLAVRENGVPKRMLGSHTIIHDTRENDIDRQLSRMLELSSDAILAYSETDGLRRWNQGAEAMYGIAESEAIGRDPTTLTQAEFEVSREEIEATLDAGKAWTGDVKRKTRTGRILITSTNIQRVEVSGDRTLLLQIDRDITERFEAQEKERHLTRELHHRTKNLFSILQGLVRLSFRLARNNVGLADKICARIDVLAKAYALSIDPDHGKTVDMHTLVSQALIPFAQGDKSIKIEGGMQPIPLNDISPLSLIINELATNASKHGALRSNDGHVSVGWHETTDRDGQDAIKFIWSENNPDPMPAKPPGDSGFGAKLVTLSAMQLGATLNQDWTKDGLICTLVIPIPQQHNIRTGSQN